MLAFDTPVAQYLGAIDTEQKLRSLSRHTQKVRPQVQQAAIFLIIVTPCNAKTRLPGQALLTGCAADRGSWEAWKCPLVWRKFLVPAAEVGVENDGHDTRGAPSAVSAVGGGAVAVPAGGVDHGLN